MTPPTGKGELSIGREAGAQRSADCTWLISAVCVQRMRSYWMDLSNNGYTGVHYEITLYFMISELDAILFINCMNSYGKYPQTARKYGNKTGWDCIMSMFV